MKKNIPGNTTPAPAKNAENTAKNRRKEAQARCRARRMRSLIKNGMPKELIEEMFAQEDNRMILVLLNGSYKIEDGVKKVKDKEVPNILRGLSAAIKFAENEKLHFMSGTPNSMWILSDKDHAEEVSEKLKTLGRVSITKPEKHDSTPAKKKEKKPTNNTPEAKKLAKAKRKASKIERAAMRSYYAALRKGGVSKRIKQHNPELAKRIESWIKKVEEMKKATNTPNTKETMEYRAKHRQLTSLEVKSNKRARKAAKRLATLERLREREKKRAEHNAKEAAKRAQKAKKPVQTELKMAA